MPLGRTQTKRACFEDFPSNRVSSARQNITFSPLNAI